MRAHLRSLTLDPDPATLSEDPKNFVLLARMFVGPEADIGEETFEVTICTGEWLAEQACAHDGIYNARHHLVVGVATFSARYVHGWRHVSRRSTPRRGRSSASGLVASLIGSSRTTPPERRRRASALRTPPRCGMTRAMRTTMAG